jgi:hypothetical protein
MTAQRTDDYQYQEKYLNDENYFPTPTKKLTEKAILDLLQFQYNRNTDQWAFFPQLRTGTGYGKDCNQYLDAWCMQLWGEQARITFEVKISRSDFLLELKSPVKRRIGLLLSNEFYFVAPKGMIKPAELPIECGLKEVIDGDRIVTRIAAPWRDTSPPTWHFLASIARRTVKEEKGEVS